MQPVLPPALLSGLSGGPQSSPGAQCCRLRGPSALLPANPAGISTRSRLSPMKILSPTLLCSGILSGVFIVRWAPNYRKTPVSHSFFLASKRASLSFFYFFQIFWWLILVYFSVRIPVIGGKQLNLYVLYVEVTRRGGYHKVMRYFRMIFLPHRFTFSFSLISFSFFFV